MIETTEAHSVFPPYKTRIFRPDLTANSRAVKPSRYMDRPAISYDRHGTPGIWASEVAAAYFGIGYLHGLHRPLQTLILSTAGRAELAARLLPRRDLVDLDTLAARLDVVRRAEQAAASFPAPAAAWLDAYVEGCRAGLAKGGAPFELRMILARLPAPTRASVLGAAELAAYLGLAEGQERMERALIDAFAAGASPALLSAMFHPHLTGFDPAALAGVPRQSHPGFAGHKFIGGGGGSNAWAVTGARSLSGRPLFASDPHLQVNQMPSLLFELRARVGDDFWLGATIPGLPGLIVGRNRTCAFGGTFAVADNVDFTIERLSRDGAARPGGRRELATCREHRIARRGRGALRVRFYDTTRGTLDAGGAAPVGTCLASRWAGASSLAASLAAYMTLPLARDAAAAERILEGARLFSLHYVLASRDGDVRYCQSGRVPRRSPGWSGLYPVAGDTERDWVGFFEGATLPRELAQDGIVASANEGRLAHDGTALTTLAQPGYRQGRIEQWLRQRAQHDLACMTALQLDLFSPQAALLAPRLLARLPACAVRDAIAAWDLRYDPNSVGAHAFELAYGAARAGLAAELGGEWFSHMLRESELGVWWCDGIDRVLANEGSWSPALTRAISASLAALARAAPAPLGQVQRFDMPHLVLGGVPLLGLDRGPFALPGSRATVRQGVVSRGVVTAPAYRFACDLGEDFALASLPGGIDGSRFSSTYDRWLSDYLAGAYHRLEPPSASEARVRIGEL